MVAENFDPHICKHGSRERLIHIFVDDVSTSIGEGLNPRLCVLQHSTVNHLVTLSQLKLFKFVAYLSVQARCDEGIRLFTVI